MTFKPDAHAVQRPRPDWPVLVVTRPAEQAGAWLQALSALGCDLFIGDQLFQAKRLALKRCASSVALGKRVFDELAIRRQDAAAHLHGVRGNGCTLEVLLLHGLK